MHPFLLANATHCRLRLERHCKAAVGCAPVAFRVYPVPAEQECRSGARLVEDLEGHEQRTLCFQSIQRVCARACVCVCVHVCMCAGAGAGCGCGFGCGCVCLFVCLLACLFVCWVLCVSASVCVYLPLCVEGILKSGPRMFPEKPRQRNVCTHTGAAQAMGSRLP